ncbi:NlpC/P60 family protein [Lysinibacillus sp. VIII_CA]|nr:NlpC/P60 family protein [Lysinibacillus sphaericus]QPA56626.1 C40 family peptidase [Lysinibacillus sphaericus]
MSHAGIYIGYNQLINASNEGVSIANIKNTYW